MPPFSAALCRGLIEARACAGRRGTCSPSFPRLYAAASLKLVIDRNIDAQKRGFPRLYAAASLKHSDWDQTCLFGRLRFPRLYAAASLKLAVSAASSISFSLFSAALCRGLIEACCPFGGRRARSSVFRGFMPRPH